MKNALWVVVVLVLMAVAVFELRYSITVDAPVVARLDRLTGKVWIVNSGAWRPVLEEQAASPVVGTQKETVTKK